jgi:hypothetical protein
MSAFGVKRTLHFAIRMSAFDPKRTSLVALHMSANEPKRTSGIRQREAYSALGVKLAL